MRYSLSLFSLLLALFCDQGATFVVHPQKQQLVSRRTAALQRVAVLFAQDGEGEQPPSESDAAPTATSRSFDDAGQSLVDEENQKRIESMGDFDSNPDYNIDNIEKMREAIRARASSLGVEKSVLSQQYIEEAKARAQQNVGQAPGQLDLSQISTGNEPRKQADWDESLPTMMYNPEDELTEEEQREIDKVGQLPFWEQFLSEVRAAQWPDFWSAGREVLLLFLVAGLSGLIIINFDQAVRSVYTNLGFIPTKDDIPGQLEGLDLPEGFTNNMNEEDLLKMTEEMNQAGKAAGLAASEVEAVVESIQTQTPDL